MGVTTGQVIRALISDTSLTPSQLSSLIGAMTDKDDEFQVNTPQKDPSLKEKKYGWMKKGDESKKLPRGTISIEAIIIAPTVAQAWRYQRLLKFTSKNSLALTAANYETRMQSIVADEDLCVWLCGAWVTDADESNPLFWELEDCKDYLKFHGFDYVEVPEIG